MATDGIFFEKGDPMPFEQVENYKKRRIRDRLDREKLLMSLERAGLDLKKTLARGSRIKTRYISMNAEPLAADMEEERNHYLFSGRAR